MTKQEAISIIQDEKLYGYNFSGKNIGANEVGFIYRKGLWEVYDTDEKANYRIIEKYQSETNALDRVIECLRIKKKVDKRYGRT